MGEIYKDCYDLARKLPYFSVKKGRIYLDIKTRIIDFHSHLGLSYFFAKPLDYLKKGKKIQYEFPARGCQIDLGLYTGKNMAINIDRKKLFKKLFNTVLSANGENSTQTIPNLLDEMDRYRIEKSVILAVDMPFSTRISKEILKFSHYDERLNFFCFVNPINLLWRKKLRSFVQKGALGIKIHPFTMMAAPNSRRTMRLLEEWSKYSLPVFFHCGYSGIEPSFTRRWVKVNKYEKPIMKYPDTIFILGHSGCAYYKEALSLAIKYPNVYLDLNGQPPNAIKEIIKKADNDRLLFGSDWPFNPIVLPLSKVLVATESMPKIREKILYNNADKLLKRIKKLKEQEKTR